MAAYSLDLRTRVLKDSDAGMASKLVAGEVCGESGVGRPPEAAATRDG